MPDKYTTNYQLSQWEADDRVQRVDFNADNAKLETALAGLEARAAVLDRLAADLAFQAGQLSIADQVENRRSLSYHAMVCESFIVPSAYTCAGGAVMANDKVTLTGAGTTGTVTAQRNIPGHPRSTQGRLWLHHDGGSVTVKLNGTPLERTARFWDPMSGKGSCVCQEYAWSGIVTNGSCTVTLELDCQTASSMEVYDFCAIFY